MKSSDREFIAESEDILDEAETHLLDIQDTSEEADPDTVNALFRCMHTLKGMSGLYGYQGMSEVSHALESLLDDIRLGKAPIDEKVLTFLLQMIDMLRSYVRDLKDGRADKEKDLSSELKQIEEFRLGSRSKEEEGIKDIPIDERILRVLSEYEEHRLKSSIKSGKHIYLARAVFSLNDFDKRLKTLNAKVKKAGESISTMPTSEGVPEGSIGFSILMSSGRDRDELESELEVDVDVLIPGKKRSVLKENMPFAVENGAEQTGPGARSSSSTVRVNISKLDTALSTIGELSVTTNTLRSVWQNLSQTVGHNPSVLELYHAVQSYERRLSELKDQVLQIRMVPVSQIYAKLGQALRRASRALEKDVLLEVFGEDTEIDKFLAEEVLDPLVHIVRNALDHGIETEKDRTALGKTRRGTIKIRSFQQGNNVVIEVSDDGRGINPEEVETKARDRGLIRKNQQLSTEDIFELLFRPGFSTSESVSEISGRGVGLDVVKEKLSALGGLVELKSRKGLGTTVILTLPITLAIVKAMIVRAGKDRFAVPLSSMSETLIMEKEKIREVEKTRYYDLRGEILPLKGLHELLGLRDNPADRPFAVVAGMGEKKIGLLVDELAGQQEIVIKPIGEYFEGVRYFAGAAEISRQEIILVLDIEAIVTDVLNQTRGAANV